MGAEKFEEMYELVAEARKHYEQFVKGKKVAAARTRKVLQNIKRLAQEIRVEVQDIKKVRDADDSSPQS